MAVLYRIYTLEAKARGDIYVGYNTDANIVKYYSHVIRIDKNVILLLAVRKSNETFM